MTRSAPHPNAAPWPPGHEPTEFQQDVIDAVSALRPGELVTFGELAIELGRPGGGQAVANVLRGVPDLPWWRVVPGEGRLYRDLVAAQQPLLEAEGHRVDQHRRVHPPD
ncbi:MAG: MGMT family protein [Ilumatobacter sp.]